LAPPGLARKSLSHRERYPYQEHVATLDGGKKGGKSVLIAGYQRSPSLFFVGAASR
jgi:hypothetical protein